MESFQKEETTGLVFQKATSPISYTLIFYRYNYLIKLCNYISSTTGINRTGNKYRWLLAPIQWKRKAGRSFCQSQVSYQARGCECVQFHLDTGERKWQHYYRCETWTWELRLSFSAEIQWLWSQGCVSDLQLSVTAGFLFFSLFSPFLSSWSQSNRYLWECGFNRSLDVLSLLLSSKMQEKQNESSKVYRECVLFPSSWVGRLH